MHPERPGIDIEDPDRFDQLPQDLGVVLEMARQGGAVDRHQAVQSGLEIRQIFFPYRDGSGFDDRSETGGAQAGLSPRLPYPRKIVNDS
ncbi:MAG: hypothetical protein CME06_13265 [Gemmatimonadetes bacterium]|nr:hypothetical protein [Gemmatimonadota bacterium]